jgi:hypothetical protein
MRVAPCNKVSEHACMLACMGWGAAALDEVAGVHLHIVQQGMQPLCLLRLQQVHACVHVPPCLHLYARVRGDCKSTSTARARMISRQGASACLCVPACGYACARAYALTLVALTHAPLAHTADRAEETRRGAHDERWRGTSRGRRSPACTCGWALSVHRCDRFGWCERAQRTHVP